MKIQTIHQQGQRAYQQDAFYIDPEQKLFIVCDGVGGGTSGDVASKLAIDTIVRTVKEAHIEPVDEPRIRQIIAQVEVVFQRKLAKEPQLRGMGTTLVMLYLHDKGATVAHIGDSRAYLIRRNGEQYWRTKDHSLVQELFDAEILATEQEMETHPQSNRITRALQAKEGARPVKADVQRIDNIIEGDVFLLATDGALEPFPTGSITSVVVDNDMDSYIPIIKTACAAQSKDNNTAVFIEIEEADQVLSQQADQLDWRSVRAEIIDVKGGTTIVSTNEMDENQPDEPIARPEPITEILHPVSTTTSKGVLSNLTKNILIFGLLGVSVFFAWNYFGASKVVSPNPPLEGNHDMVMSPSTSTRPKIVVTRPNTAPNAKPKLHVFKSGRLYGFMRGTKVVIQAKYDTVYQNFTNGQAIVGLGKLIYLIDENGHVVETKKKTQINSVLPPKDTIHRPDVPVVEQLPASDVVPIQSLPPSPIPSALDISRLDDSTWEASVGLNTIEAYENYMAQFKDGSHKEEALIRLNQLSKQKVEESKPE